MTAILAVQTGPRSFQIAADSATSDESRMYIHQDVKKIVEVGDYVIAGAGVSAYVDVFQSGIQPVTQSEDDTRTLYQFMVSEFVPELRSLHSECGYTLKDGEDFEFIVGYKGKLFYIASDYSVLRTKDGYYALGSGGNIALGALAAGAKISEAIAIAARFDIATDGPVQIVSRGGDNA